MSDLSLLIDKAAQRYGRRPSELIGLSTRDPAALDFDLAVMYRGLYAENKLIKEPPRVPRGGGNRIEKAKKHLLKRLK